MTKYSLPHPLPLKNPHSPYRNFNYIRPIYIKGVNQDLRDYQVKIVLTKDDFPLEKCKPDGSDIRFRDNTGKKLPYWIESWSSVEAIIWCKIPYIPANRIKDIWIIYGNPSASSASDGSTVFEFFDDFDDNSEDPNKWVDKVTGSYGSIEETDGRLKIKKTQEENSGLAKDPAVDGSEIAFEAGKAADFIMYNHDISGSIAPPNLISWYAQNDVHAYHEHGYLLQINDAGHVVIRLYDGSWHNLAEGTHNYWDTEIRISIQLTSGQTKVVINNGEETLTTSDTTYTSGNLHVAGGSRSLTDIYYDNFRIRKYVSPEPTVIV